MSGGSASKSRTSKSAVTLVTAKDAAPHLDPKRAVRALREADPVLGRLIDRVGPYRLEVERAHSVFTALARSIVYQQLHGKAAATIFGRVCALFPNRAAGFTPRDLLGASDEALRGAGLSRNKLLALRDLAEKTRAHQLPTLVEAEVMDDEALVEQLTRIRGIGRWTVEMFLMFRLGRPDILPLDDFGIRKGFARTFGGRAPPSKLTIERRGKKWRPYRTVASWYLWRAAELPG